MTRPRVAVGLAATWCDLYCAAVPADDAARRREEYRAHLADACDAGVGSIPLVTGALRGAIDDVRWCDEARRAAGRRPLAAELVLGRDGAVVTVMVLMVAASVASLTPSSEVAAMPFVLTAAAVLVLSRIWALHLRRVRRRRA